jgi:hypothetical protein
LKLRVYGAAGFTAGTDQELDINGKKLKLNEWQLVSFDIKGASYDNAKFSFGNGLGEILADDFKLYEVK